MWKLGVEWDLAILQEFLIPGVLWGYLEYVHIPEINNSRSSWNKPVSWFRFRSTPKLWGFQHFHYLLFWINWKCVLHKTRFMQFTALRFSTFSLPMSVKISVNQIVGSQWCWWICELQRVNNYFTSIAEQNHQNVYSLNLIYFQGYPDIAKVLETDKRRGIRVMVYHAVFSTVFLCCCFVVISVVVVVGPSNSVVLVVAAFVFSFVLGTNRRNGCGGWLWSTVVFVAFVVVFVVVLVCGFVVSALGTNRRSVSGGWLWSTTQLSGRSAMPAWSHW